MFDFLWSPEFQTALASLITLLVGGFTASLLAAGSKFITSNVNEKQLDFLKEFAALAVKAAEQGQLAGILSDKKASAMAVVQSLLDKAKISGFSVNDIEAAIEAAVLEFNQREGYFLKMVEQEGINSSEHTEEPAQD